MYSLIAMCDTFLILFFLPILQDIMQFYNMFLELKDLVTAQAFKVSSSAHIAVLWNVCTVKPVYKDRSKTK